MTSIDEIRTQGTTILVPQREILEPLTGPVLLQENLQRFEDNYDLSTSSHIYRFLAALCGEAGAGSLKRKLLFPKLQNALESTHFSDLDQLYGNPLSLARLSTEIYSINPRNEVMTQLQWQDVLIRDAAFRARCLTWVRALIQGPTKRGIALAAEAACGYECDVFEQYEYLDNQVSDNPITMTNIGQTSSRQEFVIIPRAPSITEADRRNIIRLVDRLRPVNTISSVTQMSPVHDPKPILNAASTSDNFYITRLVTGQTDISWPAVDLSVGFWIEPGIEKEAPTFAFLSPQETSTFLSVADTSASSEHVGQFDVEQRALFGNLQNEDPTYVYDSSFSYAKAFAPLQVISPWLRGYENENDISLVNRFYPLDYFGQSNISQFPIDDPSQFWASEEQLAPTSEWLIIDFGSERPFNYLDFEVSQKPIDFKFEYYDSGTSTWVELTFDTDYVPKNSVTYLTSLDSPWSFVENHFARVTTKTIRVTYIRRDEVFPLITSDPIRWSIEVRNLHAAHNIVTANDFEVDSGVDILGNSYRTDIITMAATNLISGSQYWQSQPNPIANAVEAIYFDLRSPSGTQAGTMLYLDNSDILDSYDGRSLGDMELYHPNGVVIDEIFMDPITFGPSMHFYYSNDNEAEWDQKLWSPVPRHYRLKKGFHGLPSPISCKYFKIEFSDLVPIPYQTPEYPIPSEITYRKFPSWVQNHFATSDVTSSLPNPFDRITIDPLIFGFQRPQDMLDTNYGSIRLNTSVTTDNEVRDFISTISNQTPTDIQSDMESRIQFRSSFMYQQDLLSQLDEERALSRFVLAQESDINAELPPIVEPTPDTQSIVDLTSEREFKVRPIMFFPRRCRHEYQVLRGTNTQKIAYFVGVKQVGFYRRNYGVAYDESIYIETLDDTANISSNDFIADTFGYVITP